jgi:hypothetical protein
LVSSYPGQTDAARHEPPKMRILLPSTGADTLRAVRYNA